MIPIVTVQRRNATERALWAKVWRGVSGIRVYGEGRSGGSQDPGLSLYYLFSRRSCRLNGGWGVARKLRTSACFAFHSSCQINRFLL